MLKAAKNHAVQWGSRLVRALDWTLPKDSRLWVFVTSRSDQWGSSQHALYEYAQSRGEIATTIVHLRSLMPTHWSECLERWRLLRAGVIVIHHGPSDFRWLCHPKPCCPRVIYNVWHGVNLKGIGLQASPTDEERRQLQRSSRYYTETIATSESNRQSLASGLGLPLETVCVTGLPRNDWLDTTRPLPTALAEQERRLERQLAGKKLLLYAPTFRGKSGSGVYPFEAAEAERLARFLDDAGFVLGIRAHINAKGFSVPPWALDVGSAHYPETQVLLRNTHAMITDYSGIWVDYLLLGRPMLLFLHDSAAYDGDRGLIYDLHVVFPGPIVETFEELVTALANITREDWTPPSERLAHALDTFHAHRDSHATPRVYERIRELTANLR